MRDRFSGFSLLEIVIALFILSYGILSILSMQTRMVKVSYSSYLRAVAVTQFSSGYERLLVGNKQAELQLWIQNNKKLLPHSSSGYDSYSNLLFLCWQNRLSKERVCLGEQAEYR